MRIAVLGVGLIGGSVGLAARRRLDAEVAGFDPDPARLAKAEELGAISSRAGSLAEACDGAELVFCAGPVAALPALAAAALEAAGADCTVTDVGSVKGEVIERLGGEGRFVGGHPLAGAETAGVEQARDDLFDGARWYLTPTTATEGIAYDRLQRALADLGARPQAIDAGAHDRLMATVSHLPHVVANVLAGRAVAALDEGSGRLPEIGPSFRDATRIAGANPAIWADIFVGNRETVAEEVESAAAALSGAAELIRSGDRDAVAAWQREAGERRRLLLEDDLAGGPLQELRLLVPNRPGIVAEIALALGEAGVNIEDMALYPSADMSAGAISLYVAGEEEAARAEGLVRGLGHDATRVER
ncbi:MAG: prephenate dehydrogenase/arogenate dehydrogenase family protein [Solirubrobacterales bacterium]|nr:prephenate dehydrogenase/arogenate dehydrogenase family protein [Solirubrobacterales bacterium]